VIERDEEGYYVASVPQIPACHTQARSLDEVIERIREAIEVCLEVDGAPGARWSSSVSNGLRSLHEPDSTCHGRRTDRGAREAGLPDYPRYGQPSLSWPRRRPVHSRARALRRDHWPSLLHKILRDCQVSADELRDLL